MVQWGTYLPVRACSVIPGVFNFLYINQSVKVNFVGYFIVDFLRWIFYAAAKQAKLSGKMSKLDFVQNNAHVHV